MAIQQNPDLKRGDSTMKLNTIAKATLTTLATGLVLSGSLAVAAPDLRITSMQMVGQAREGRCNKVRMTVRNQGNQFSNTATLDIFLATHTQGASNQNRATKNLFISPLQPNRQVQFTISNVEFKAQGAMTAQGLVDSTQEIAENSENNNTRTLNVNVQGVCGQQTRRPPPQQNKGCDLQLKFTKPSGSYIAWNKNNTFRLLAKNVGKAKCKALKLRLYRYKGGSTSGYGSAVGGTANIKQVNALNPGQAQTISFADNPRARAIFTYAPKILGPWNDDNNSNHRPKKTVKAQ